MRRLIIPEGYRPMLSLRDTQKAIKMTKDLFQTALAEALSLDRITAPLMVTEASGINDDLSGVERKVAFEMKEIGGVAEVVQSLAKWKRMALYRYGYEAGVGIYTDMNAIRRDDDVDNIHSVYVDQWDWERVITREERSLDFLKDIVSRIVRVLSDVKRALRKAYPVLSYDISPDVYFITSEELLRLYPDMTAKERENAVTKEHGCVFIMQIGGALSNGERHDSRAPDYDDWSLNGDLLVWDPVLSLALEISSMGIRVDESSIVSQLRTAGAEERLRFPYHKMVKDGTLPLTIGGGIGQSRLCMLILEKAHIGEVQCSIWPEEMLAACKKHNIVIL